jgi:hypothetical protein
MRAQLILAHLRKQPFIPIRVFMSDGATYDVRHPEMAAVSAAEMVIGIEPLDDEVPHRFAYCDPVHIARIEPIDGDNRGRGPRGKKTRRK